MSIKHAILALLLDEPRSASQVKNEFTNIMSGTLNIGQVAQTLSRLQRDGHIEPAGTVIGATGHTAETYALTPAGKTLIDDWFSTPIVTPASERDELVTKVAFAEVRGINLIRLLDTQREALMSELRGLNRRSRELPETRTADRLLIERRIFELEAQARWLDRVESLQTPKESNNG